METAARIIVRLPEIAKLQPHSRPVPRPLSFLPPPPTCALSFSRLLRLQKYERDYTERYFGSVSSANETREKARVEKVRGGLARSHPGQRARNTVCGMDYASAKSNKLILRRMAAATTTAAGAARARGALSRGAFRLAPMSCARIFTGCSARAAHAARIHARARARARACTSE